MACFKPPQPLAIGDNVSHDWVSFKERFSLFLKATEWDSKKSDEIKIAQFLNVIGEDAYSIFKTFKLGPIDSLKFEDVIKAFDEHFTPKKNVVYQRFLFFKKCQKAGEPFLNFITDLRKLASYCDFGDQEDSLIRDRLVLCIDDVILQERLLRIPDLKLDVAIKQCQLWESSNKQFKDVVKNKQETVNGTVKEELVHEMVKYDGKFKGKPSTSSFNNYKSNAYQCKKCNTKHMRGECLAHNKQCYNCGELNHFSIGCMKPRKNSGRKVQEVVSHQQFNIDGISAFEIDKMNSLKLTCSNVILEKVDKDNAMKDLQNEIHASETLKTINNMNNTHETVNNTSWFQPIELNGKVIDFKIDTGAEINLVPLHVLKQCRFNEISLENCNVRLECYGGFRMAAAGKINLKCRVNNIELNEEFIVIDNDKCIPILGLKSCVNMGLINRVHSLRLESKEKFIETNQDVFTGIGCFPTEYHIKLKNGATPVVRPPRRVPLALMPKLRDTLKELEQLGIISKNDKPSSYVSNLVIVEKPDKSLRLCLDPQALNKDIISEPYLIPTLEEIKSNLANKTCYSVFDCSASFYHVKLDKASAEICTFSSPYGCYSFNRLPFGVSVAPQLFHKLNSDIFSNIEGVTVYFDDLLIAASDKKTHDEILMKVLDKARQNNVKFNPKKLQLNLNRVSFVGHIFSSNGVSIDEKHVECIKTLPSPTNKKELQKVLGLFNYFREYIPDMSNLISPLRELLKESNIWQWLPIHSECIEKLKIAVTTAPVLATFDCSKPIELHADSSKDAVGFCLIQCGKPVSFGSRALTPTESQYAQVEKEMLSICIAVKKYHHLLYGRKFVVYNDSKPLSSIMDKPIGKIMSPRLQRLKLKLLKYNLKIEYKPGKTMIVADFLSRMNQPENTDSKTNDCTFIHMLDIVVPNVLAISDEKRQLFRKETSLDPALSLICNFYENGWPANKQKVPEIICVYYNMRNDIYVNDGLVFLNDKIIVPFCLREDMLKLLHESHFGIDKTRARAREVMYWPGMSIDIENLVSSCSHCQKYMNAKAKETLISHEIPDLPFSKLAVDIAEIGPDIYLIVVDYLSKWVDVLNMRSKTATEVIKHLKLSFSTHGIPVSVVGDNNPFGSYEFKEFAREWGFNVVNSSPVYPRSNGQVERTIQTVKKIIKKCADSGKDLQIALLEYRNMPVIEEWSPAQILFSRRLRTKLPVSKKLLTPSVCDLNLIKKKIETQQAKSKEYYNKTAKVPTCFELNDPVYVYNVHKKIWESGVIIGKTQYPRSYVVKLECNGSVLRRNSIHIRKRSSDLLGVHDHFIGDNGELPGDNGVRNDPGDNGVRNDPGENGVRNDLDDNGARNDPGGNGVRGGPGNDGRGHVNRFGRIIRRPQKLDL